MLMLARRRPARGHRPRRRSQTELGGFVATLPRRVAARRSSSGPILQGITEIAARHRRPPAGVARADREGARPDAARDRPSSTRRSIPSAVAGKYLLRRRPGGGFATVPIRSAWSTTSQKLQVRLTRLAESIERIAGARPGQRLQVQFSGTEQLELTIRNAARRVCARDPGRHLHHRDAASPPTEGGRQLGADDARHRRRACSPSVSCSTLLRVATALSRQPTSTVRSRFSSGSSAAPPRAFRSRRSTHPDRDSHRNPRTTRSSHRRKPPRSFHGGARARHALAPARAEPLVVEAPELGLERLGVELHRGGSATSGSSRTAPRHDHIIAVREADDARCRIDRGAEVVEPAVQRHRDARARGGFRP